MTDADVHYMLEPQVIITIFKLNGGSSESHYTVSELPLFSTEIKWVTSRYAKTDYVLDASTRHFCIPLWKFPYNLVQKCNEAWNDCIEKNLDSITFTYTYDKESGKSVGMNTSIWGPE